MRMWVRKNKIIATKWLKFFAIPPCDTFKCYSAKRIRRHRRSPKRQDRVKATLSFVQKQKKTSHKIAMILWTVSITKSSLLLRTFIHGIFGPWLVLFTRFSVDSITEPNLVKRQKNKLFMWILEVIECNLFKSVYKLFSHT